MHNGCAEDESAPANDWLVWQLADSAFPVGSFAHSSGLEPAWQQNRVPDGESLSSFVEASLSQAARASLPIVMDVHREAEQFDQWDAFCNAMLTNHVANRASRGQGISMLSAAERIFAEPGLGRLRASLRCGKACAHLAPVFGFVCSALKIPATQTARLFIFCHLRGLISAAVRLGIVGPLEGQAIQMRLSSQADRVARRGMELPASEAAQTAPILELISATHDRAYSRLFQS